MMLSAGFLHVRLEGLVERFGFITASPDAGVPAIGPGDRSRSVCLIKRAWVSCPVSVTFEISKYQSQSDPQINS